MLNKEMFKLSQLQCYHVEQFALDKLQSGHFLKNYYFDVALDSVI